MIDYYLKFTDKAEAESVLYTVHPAVYEADMETGAPTDKVISEEYTTPNYRNIDVLGVLYEKQEVVDPENPPEPVPMEGWHVNVRVMPGEDGEPLEAFKVNPEPQQWRRVWS